jgi:RNA polymerase sigma-70 factor (ECF subfamily)
MEQRLVELAQRGDQQAFASIAFSISPRLFAIAQRILRDYHRAEDATQQAIVLIWRDLPRLGDPDRFDAWAYRVLVNVCYQEAQRQRRGLAAVRRLDMDSASISDTEDSFADRDMLQRAFDRLPVEQRAVLVLQYYLDLDQAEIAQTLGIPVGTVKSRASHARSALRAALEADARPEIARWTA